MEIEGGTGKGIHHRGAEQRNVRPSDSTELTPKSATKSSSSSCSCSKRVGSMAPGLVRPLRSAYFVGRRSLRKGAIRATYPRLAIGRARTSAGSVESLSRAAPGEPGFKPSNGGSAK